MLVVTLIGLIAVFLSYYDGRGLAKNGFAWGFILITVIMSIRYDFGTDYLAYLEEFNMYSSTNINIFDYNAVSRVAKSELGWVYLMLLFRPLGFYSFVVFLTIIENIFLYDIIKRNVSQKWLWLAVFIYVFSPTFLLTGCAMMRQWLAITIIVFSTKFIEKKQFIQFAICLVLAFFFHKSAIVGILVFFLSFIHTIKGSYYVGAILAAFLIHCFIYSDVLSIYLTAIFDSDTYKVYEHYTEERNMSSMNLLGVISTFTMPIMCLILIPKIKENEMLYLLLFLVSIVFIPLRDFSRFMLRMEIYFTVFSIVLFPIVLSKIKHVEVRTLLALFIILTSLSGFINIWRAPASSWQASFHEYHTIFYTMLSN